MKSIDTFIHQLIHSGLAVSFLTAVKKHYLKINEVYYILSDLEEEKIEKMTCQISDKDTMTVEVFLRENINQELYGSSNEDFDVSVTNCGNIITITVSNNNGNEDDIYETRLTRYEKGHNNKWS